MKTHHKIIEGDSRQMIELKDNSVHLIITSRSRILYRVIRFLRCVVGLQDHGW
jgi:hypothetical protein